MVAAVPARRDRSRHSPLRLAQAALVVGTNTGELWRVGAFTGRVLARYDLLYSSTVLSVAVAETGEIAAGLANGQVAFLERVKDER